MAWTGLLFLVGISFIIFLISWIVREKPDAVAKDSKVKPPAKQLTLEQMLANLQSCGIELDPKYSVQDFESEHDRDRLENGYDYVLSGLANSEHDWDQPAKRFCDSLYLFDTECIYGNEGDYTNHIKGIAALSKGDLVITDTHDELEQLDEQGIELRSKIDLKCNGQLVHMDFKQNDDWFDPAVLEELDKLMLSTGSKRRYFAVDLGDDQCALIGCLLPEQIEKLKQAAGVAIVSAQEGIVGAIAAGKGAEDQVAKALQRGDIH